MPGSSFQKSSREGGSSEPAGPVGASARAGLEEAKRLFLNGAEPGHLLNPGRLLELEAACVEYRTRLAT